MQTTPILYPLSSTLDSELGDRTHALSDEPNENPDRGRASTLERRAALGQSGEE